MTDKTKLKISSILLTISGLSFVVHYSRWEIAIGIFLVTMGNSIERRLQWKEDLYKYDKGEL